MSLSRLSKNVLGSLQTETARGRRASVMPIPRGVRRSTHGGDRSPSPVYSRNSRASISSFSRVTIHEDGGRTSGGSSVAMRADRASGTRNHSLAMLHHSIPATRAEFKSTSTTASNAHTPARQRGAQRHGSEALHFATMNQDERTVQRLLAARISPNAQNKLGQTPLHLASMQGVSGGVVIDLLLSARADPTVRDNEGNTASDLVMGLSSRLLNALEGHANGNALDGRHHRRVRHVRPVVRFRGVAGRGGARGDLKHESRLDVVDI